MPKDPKEMTISELTAAFYTHANEHDIDCEEGGPKDRCLACLATALHEKVG